MSVQRFHRDETGAIAMLALAGILITFMTALILFDAGFAVRHKLKAQISADAGAYSQAAVKARVMNDIAYMNVVKRTMLGVWGMYVGMMYQFYREAVGAVLCALAETDDLRFLHFFGGDADGTVRTLFRSNAGVLNAECDQAAEQYDIFWHEAFGDWIDFAGAGNDITRRGSAAFTSEFSSNSAQLYRINIKRLDDMQRMLVDTTPKWAKVEGAVRARASGSEKVDTHFSELPTRRGTKNQVCLRGTAHQDGSIASGSELRAEILANRNLHSDRSLYDSKFKRSHDPSNLAAGLGHMGGIGCTSVTVTQNFDESMAPWIPTREESQDFVNTGRETPLEQYREDHFLFLRADADLGHPKVGEYEGVSCGEIVDLAPEYRGFRASWAPRIAPVGKCVPANAGWWK